MCVLKQSYRKHKHTQHHTTYKNSPKLVTTPTARFWPLMLFDLVSFQTRGRNMKRQFELEAAKKRGNNNVSWIS